MFNLNALQVSTKANTRQGGNFTGNSRVYPNLTFGIKKTKTKKDDGTEEIGLRGVFKFSKAFFEASGIAKSTHSIKYANDKANGKLYILVLEGKGDSCNFNEEKAKGGSKSQEFRSSELERFAQEVNLLPEEQPEGFKQALTLTKLDVEIAAPYTAVYEVSLAQEGDGDADESEDAEGEVSDSLEATEETSEVPVVTETANDDFM